METNISKSLKEVWEWKEKAYNQIKHLSLREQLQAIHEKTAATIEKIEEEKKEKLKNTSRNS